MKITVELSHKEFNCLSADLRRVRLNSGVDNITRLNRFLMNNPSSRGNETVIINCDVHGDYGLIKDIIIASKQLPSVVNHGCHDYY